MDSNNNKCMNCGLKGHYFNQCTEPITSLGIICYRINKEINQLEYLLICRKDSLGYTEFLRGKYKLNDEKYLIQLFSEMTKDEVHRLLTKDFDTLWTNLWLNVNTKYYINEYHKCKEKFKNFMSNRVENIINIINQVEFFWNEPEWGFPKGRRNKNEDDLTSAIREFIEETGLKLNDFKIIENIKPLEEIFIGSNNIKYKHIYYIAKCNKLDLNVSINKNKPEQYCEISKIEWLSYQDAISRLRNYNKEKIELLETLHNGLITIHKMSDINKLYIY